MNRRKKNFIILCGLFTVLLTSPVLGKANKRIVEEDTVQCAETFVTEPDAAQSARNHQDPKRQLIAAGYVQISNESPRGVLGVYAETLCHTYVDKIAMRIYLDILVPATDEEEEDWYTVTYYDYNWTREDAPDKELYAVSVSFDLCGLEQERYYRLRGAHYIYSGDCFEGRSSQTAFIPLS